MRPPHNYARARANIALCLAVFVTVCALALAVSGAWQRAESLAPRLMLAAVSCVIVVAVHLLPALLGKRHALMALPIWFLCLLAAMYGHATFFVGSWEAAARERSARVEQVESDALDGKRRAVEQALAEIKARPVATVAAALARATGQNAERLRVELAEASKAAALREELIALAQAHVGATTKAVADPVTDRVAKVTGWSPDAVSLTANGGVAVLVEVLGTLFWLIAFSYLNQPEAASRREAKKTPVLSLDQNGRLATMRPEPPVKPVLDTPAEPVEPVPELPAEREDVAEQVEQRDENLPPPSPGNLEIEQTEIGGLLRTSSQHFPRIVNRKK